MVTPSEAGTDYELVLNLVGGMNCIRIHCAYDPEAITVGLHRS